VEGQSSGGEDGKEGADIPEGAIRLEAHEEPSGALRIAVRGDLDLNTVDALRPALEAACGSRAGVTLDLRAVEFIDSAGLALLVDARKRFTPPCTIRLLVSARGQVQRVLRLGKFDTFFDVEAAPEA
jgi:anti-sigma B factor antagonist